MKDISILNDLLDNLCSRRYDSPEVSYTAKLFAKGLLKVSQKVGEEATEVIIAAIAEEKQDCIGEIADLMYHLTVMMVMKDISWQDIAKKLHERMNMSGLEEKAARKFKT